MKHILVVDDDEKLRALIVDYLSQHDFRVTGVGNSGQLAQVLSTDAADLIIVDRNLGCEDGLEIVRSLAGTSDAPIIIISGDRLEEADKVVGLELGACDYITKPFSLHEFLARIRAALRKTPQLQPKQDRRCYSFEAWMLDLRRRQLLHDSKQEIKLTAAELNLLLVFLREPRQILSRERLLSATCVRDDEKTDRSIDILILRLRRKLESDPSQPRLIRTERGAGYVFDAEVSVENLAETVP
ncbi:winged helix-turn-helix domain-containing protein [Bradyrhizobium sp.]|uniref:winged helix-turn-helix domain-containing protein n=1 Tax=Bradyrhizobium sp. TaxID=376 RepID=UPI003C4FF785